MRPVRCHALLLPALLLGTLHCAQVRGLCTQAQLDLSLLERSLGACRAYSSSSLPQKATSPSPVTPKATSSSSVRPSSSPWIPISRSLTPSTRRPTPITLATVLHPSYASTINQQRGSSRLCVEGTFGCHGAPSSLPQQLIPPWPFTAQLRDEVKMRPIIRGGRVPRSYTSAGSDPVDPLLSLSRDLITNNAEDGAWDVGLFDKKCVFYCAFAELGLMDDEGRVVPGELRKMLEQAASSRELQERAAELAELCQYKMLHVSTIGDSQQECDFPIMLTRCILGRLSKHCEEEEAQKRRRQSELKAPSAAMHPDVEFIH